MIPLLSRKVGGKKCYHRKVDLVQQKLFHVLVEFYFSDL